MEESGLSTFGAQFSAHPIGSAIAIAERGLVYADGSLLVRMRKTAEGRQELAIGADRARMLAMLSVAYGRPVTASDVVPHIESAAEHWRRGEKALASLRLMFAGLPGPSDPAADHRVALAACLLDQGWPPAALLEELGLSDGATGLEKYNPNHVSAGHGERSGQFDFRSGASPTADGRIVVAGEESEKEYEERALLGGTTLKEDEEHHRLLPRDAPIPFFGGAVFSPKEALSAAAAAAAAKVGPGKGPVHGTAVHKEFNNQVKALGRDDLHGEQSYKNGRRVDYGTPGSVRVDAAEGDKYQPTAGHDLKTGSAPLPPRRVKQFQEHMPLRKDGTKVPIYKVPQ